MAGVPASIGDWGIKGVFREGGRLLIAHLGDVLPVILVCFFPAAVIKVLHTQFFVADFVGPQGSSYIPAPTSFWPAALLSLFWSLPYLLIVIGFVRLGEVLNNSFYISDLRTGRDSQSLYRSVNQTGDSFELLCEMSKGKKLKSFFALFSCFMLYVIISSSGINFTPEAIAAMGLPPWSIFLFTLLIVTITTLITSYFLIVTLVVFVWIWSPKTPILA